MASQPKTSVRAGKAASKVLRSVQTGRASKTAAGSALSQRAPATQEAVTFNRLKLNAAAFMSGRRNSSL